MVAIPHNTAQPDFEHELDTATAWIVRELKRGGVPGVYIGPGEDSKTPWIRRSLVGRLADRFKAAGYFPSLQRSRRTGEAYWFAVSKTPVECLPGEERL